jgi:uncharacterized protein YjbI with pentapeptide repeats
MQARASLIWESAAVQFERGQQWLLLRRRRLRAVVAAALALLWLWAIRRVWLKLTPQWDPSTIIAIAVVAVVLMAVIWWLWWRLPQRQVRGLDIPDVKDRADTEDNFRKTAGQALGGAAVLIGAVAAYLQFTQQQQASHDLLISNQVLKSFEQLGSKETATRLGGIYGLEGVMNTSEQYHQPVLEALCAFVRESTKDLKIPPPDPKTGILSVPVRMAATDVQAVLTVIGRRKDGLGEVNLSGANIPGTNLDEAHLDDALFINAHLEGASLIGVHLDRAALTRAHLRGADLSVAHLKRAGLFEAHLEGANLSEADLEDAILIGAHFKNADFHGANLSRASLFDADLTGARLNSLAEPLTSSGADLNNADLSGTNLTDADLSDVAHLTQAQLDQACGKPKALPRGLTLDKPCPPSPPGTQGNDGR